MRSRGDHIDLVSFQDWNKSIIMPSSLCVCVCVCVCVCEYVSVCVSCRVDTHSRGVSHTVLSSIQNANLFSNISNPSKFSIVFRLKHNSTVSLTMVD